MKPSRRHTSGRGGRQRPPIIETPAALDDLLVLDLSDDGGIYCAKLLADLGADVIRVEPPSGDRCETVRPSWRASPARAASASSTSTRTSEASRLTGAASAGARSSRGCFERVDVVIDGFRPSEAARLGLAREDLRHINPHIVRTSITAFGQTGPHADWVGTDLIAQAMSGVMVLNGLPEDPPVRLPLGQAYHLASLHAALGTLAAVLRRDATREGAEIDISMQDSLALTTAQVANLNLYTRLGQAPHRAAGRVTRVVNADGTLDSGAGSTWKASDGWVQAWQQRRALDDHTWRRSLAWLIELGEAADLPDPMYSDPQVRAASAAHIREVVRLAIERHPKETARRASMGGATTMGRPTPAPSSTTSTPRS